MSQSDEAIERILRFNCNEGCDGDGVYLELGMDGEWKQKQCEWCYAIGMPARDAIQAHETEARIDELEKLDKTTDANGVQYITGVVYGVIIERIEYLRKLLTGKEK